MQFNSSEQVQVDNNATPRAVAGQSLPGPASQVRIQHLTWLSDGMLLAAGSSQVDVPSPSIATLVARGKTIAAEMESVSYGTSDGHGADAAGGALMLIRCQPGTCADEVPERLVLGAGPGALAFEATQLPRRVAELSSLLRETVAGLDAEARAHILRFLVHACAERLTGANAVRTSMSLFAARQALRERLREPALARGEALEGHVDAFVIIDLRSFYVIGWIASSDSPLTRVTVVSPEGWRVELLDRLSRYRRSDLDGTYGAMTEDGDLQKLGFSCYFQADAPSHLRQGWLIEVTNASGGEIELPMPTAERDATAVRNVLLSQMIHATEVGGDLLLDHLEPALRQVQDRRRDQVHIQKVAQYGIPPINPIVTIIVPLYGRIDFLEQQMAQFVHDSEIHQADIIYVLDSPELSDDLFTVAPWLERLYRVPFRVAALRSNAGFSGANNAGVSLAQGRLLLLLNADVLPDRPGWLGKMAGFYDGRPKIGALGPKLLYEDEAIQHAGLYFHRDPATGVWRNEHYFKGLHRTLPLANVTRRVPAVTAGCLLIATELYRAMGGLAGIYVQGDYEDSDLCLRLSKCGRENWYLADVELYHLEGQSYPNEVRQLASRYNRWLHTRLWDDYIRTVMEEFNG